MSLIYPNRYPDRYDPQSTSYPQGKFRNRSSVEAHDGGYFEQDLMNDWSGFFGALLQNGGVVPNGQVDTALNSQYYNALVKALNVPDLTNVIDDSEDKAVNPKGVWDFVKAELDKLIPVGTTHIWLTDTAPDGYLFAKGQAFSEAQYPKLAQLFPSLKLPDFRGVVPRGLDDGRGFDTGRGLLSYQEDAMQLITGGFNGGWKNMYSWGSIYMNQDKIYDAGSALIDSPAYNSTAGADQEKWDSYDFNSSRQTRTANESRMKNIATNFIIKAG